MKNIGIIGLGNIAHRVEQDLLESPILGEKMSLDIIRVVETAVKGK